MLLLLKLYTILYASISGIEAHSIHACSGESVRLFQNISIKGSGIKVTLYKNPAVILSFTTSNAEQKEERVFHDNYGNIWMHNIDVSDDATYTVVQATDHKHKNKNVLGEVRLIVLIAPEKSCRPQLTRDGNTLIASLETDASCGKPRAKASWLYCPSIAHQSHMPAQLSSGREAGTYYACIETQALRCVRELQPADFCSSLTIEESNYNTGSVATWTFITTLSALFFVMLLMTVANLRLIGHIKEQKKPSASDPKQERTVKETPFLI